MKYENGYVNSFVKLIQCPTVTNSGHEYFDAFHKVLDEEFPHVTATCQKIQVGGDALLYKWKGKSSDKPLVLMAHQDVVPVVESDWHYPPYGGQIVDGKVYGRGAMDCKNTLFSTIQACDELIAEGFVPEQDVYLSYSDNEETSGPGASMARDWFKSQGITPFLVIDEGGAIMRKGASVMKKTLLQSAFWKKAMPTSNLSHEEKAVTALNPRKNAYSKIVRIRKLLRKTHRFQTKSVQSRKSNDLRYG